jgi:hypothetical protein
MAPRFAFVPARWLAADSGLKPADRLTLCVLCQWVNRESGECFPSIATIAAHAALSENTVRAALRRLEKVGALEVKPRTDGPADLNTVAPRFAIDSARRMIAAGMKPKRLQRSRPVT